MKEHYAKFVMTVEKCDEEVYRGVQQFEGTSRREERIREKAKGKEGK